MVRWLRWHCPPDTGFEIRALAVWGRARYLSVTEAPHSTNFHTWMGKKQFCFFQTAETGSRTPDSGVKGSGANHYPRAPAPENLKVSEPWNKKLSRSRCYDHNITLIYIQLFGYRDDRLSDTTFRIFKSNQVYSLNLCTRHVRYVRYVWDIYIIICLPGRHTIKLQHFLSINIPNNNLYELRQFQ